MASDDRSEALQRPPMDQPAWQFACPACGAALQATAPAQLACPQHATRFEQIDGIWRLLRPERKAHFAQFVAEYETVRRAEGRGSRDPAYYRALPFHDLSGRMPAMWDQRAQAFNTFVRGVLEPLEAARPRLFPLRILDLGAGNGWLSYRLAQRGHHLAAIDLTTNHLDGLGCARYYDAAFTAVQAEFDRLPFATNQADLAVFNAALHYSPDIAATLAAIVPVLRPGGRIVVIDTPVYHDETSGRRMVAEREAAFQQRYGFPSRAIPSENFLTFKRIGALSRELALDWRFVWPVAGWRRALRRGRDRLRGRREAARFPILVGTSAG